MKEELRDFQVTLHVIVKKITAQRFNTFDLQGRTGGYLTILDAHRGKIISITCINEINDGNDDKYFDFSQEKAYRLFNKQRTTSHNTSWESRNEKEMRFAGAIRFQQYIFSFSGFPELVDEAILFAAKLFAATESERKILSQYVMAVYNARKEKEGLTIFNEIKDRWV